MINTLDAHAQWQLAQDGTRIPTIQGKFVCSSRGPLKEASSWVKAYGEELTPYTIIAVIGLGAGFHVIELSKRYPEKEIFVFEKNQELISAFQFTLERYKNISVIQFDTLESVMGKGCFELLCKDGSPILSFMPACQAWVSDAKMLQRSLLGHCEKSLQKRLYYLTGTSLPLIDLGKESSNLMSFIEDLSGREDETSAYWAMVKELVR